MGRRRTFQALLASLLGLAMLVSVAGPVAACNYHIKVTKLDAANSAPLQGAGFTLYNGTGTTHGIAQAEKTTGSSGIVTFELGYVPGNTYTIVETKVPAGYQKAPDKTIKIGDSTCGDEDHNGDAYCAVTMSDPRLYNLVVAKTDGASGGALAGAGFTLKQSGSAIGGEILTGANGTATWSNLVAGSYTIVETKVPAGYARVPDQSVTIPGAGCTTTVPRTCTVNLSDPRLYDLAVVKLDAATGGPMAGVGFTLKQGGVAVGAERITGADGKATWSGLAAGSYVIVETTAPAGYAKAADQPVTVPNAGCTTSIPRNCTVTVSDPRLYDLAVLKIDGTNEVPMPGVGFTLEQGGVAVGPEVITGANGKATWSGLAAGSYTIVETTVPAGYAKAPDQSVTVPNASCTTAVPFTCAVTVGDSRLYDLRVTKLDAVSQAPLTGAGFTLEQGGVAIGPEVITGPDGIAKFSGLAAGSYTIVETRVPDGYSRVGDVEVVLPDTSCTSAVPFTCATVIRDSRTYDLVVVKLDKVSQAPLAGAGFTLMQGGVAIGDEVMTGASGKAAFKGLAAGAYTIVETTVPAGYAKVADEHVTIPLAEEGCTAAVPFTCTVTLDDARLYDLVVTKIDKVNEHPLANAGFTLEQGGVAVGGEAMTGANGKATFTGLAAGTYTIVETTVPAGYSKAADREVTVPNDDCTSTAPFTCGAVMSDPRLYDLVVQKYDRSDKSAMAGAGFTLSHGSWSSDEVVTGADGTVRFTGLAAGTYTLSETTVPAGYAKADDLTVTVPEDSCTAAVPFTCTVTIGDPRLYDLAIVKRDGVSEGAMAGAGFTLSQGSWTSAEVVTGPNGKALFTNLPAGTYTIKETTVPAGYAKAEDQTVSIPNDSCSSAVPFTCTVTIGDPRLYDLAILKLDSESEAGLPGAGFTLQHGSWTSDEILTGADGKALFTNLPAGTYTIKETTVPVGYSQADDVTVTVPDDSCTDQVPFTCAVTIKDVHLYDLTVQKKDRATGDTMSGVGFRLLQGDWWVTDEVFTGANGLATFHDLVAGEYTIVETTVPDGYAKADDQTVSVPYGSCEPGPATAGCSVEIVVIEDDAIPVTLTLIKASCPEYGLVPANRSPEVGDMTGGHWAELNDEAQTILTTPDDIPAGCSRVGDWTFKVDGEDVVTGPDGSVDVALTAAQISKARMPTWDGGILVSEVIPEDSDLGFGALRCYRDIANGDNLEAVFGLHAKDTHLYCIAFNVEVPEASQTPYESAGGETGTPVVTPSATAVQSIEGATATPVKTATPPPTSTPGSNRSNDGQFPLFGLLICMACGALGMLYVTTEKRSVRRR